VASRLRSGQASNPSELGANEWRGQRKRGPLFCVNVDSNGLGCTRPVQEKMPKLAGGAREKLVGAESIEYGRTSRMADSQTPAGCQGHAADCAGKVADSVAAARVGSADCALPLGPGTYGQRQLRGQLAPCPVVGPPPLWSVRACVCRILACDRIHTT
jgi:hypothetical protein